MTPNNRIRWIAKPIVFAAALGPFAWLVWLVFAGGLGANPAETMNRFLGDWALRFLLLALAVTPARGLTGWGTVMVFRRMIGLFAFFYVLLHLSSYTILNLQINLDEFLVDVAKRPFITIGVINFVGLAALAATSTRGMIRRLGGRNWRRLHMLIYGISVLGLIHFIMMIRADFSRPFIYGGCIVVLLGYRLWTGRRKRIPA